jgi:hypothetical protein
MSWIMCFLLVFWGGVILCLVGTSATFGPFYWPRLMDDDECGAVGGMIDRGNRSTRRKPTPVPLCPQIAHELTWARITA